MKYLITGITGFAGPHLARLILQNGHEVHGILRGSNGREMDLLDVLSLEELNSIKFQYCDLTDLSSLYSIFSAYQYDGVFHLAAQSHPPTSFTAPVKTYSDNVMGSVNLIESIQRFQSDCRLMFCSTSEVYGAVPEEKQPIREDFPLEPVNPYGASKAAIDLFMQERCGNGFVNGYITRAFSHTGPRRGSKFSISWDAYYLAKMSVSGSKDRSLPVGNLSSKRVVIDVRDTVRAYYMLMQDFDNGHAYNVCGPIDTLKTMQFFTDMLIDISGLENVEKTVSEKLYRPIDIPVQIGDTAKLVEKTGWKPEIAIEQTLKDLFDYWTRKLTM